jgi:hypothetical protein
MPFASGDKVRIKYSDLVGIIVCERNPGANTYLVRIERYYPASDLEPESPSPPEPSKGDAARTETQGTQ